MNNDKPPSIVAGIAPTGTLRAAINMGNAVLAGRDRATGTPKGVTADLAGMLAERLGVTEVVRARNGTMAPPSRSMRSSTSAPTSASSRSTRSAAPMSRSRRPMC